MVSPTDHNSSQGFPQHQSLLRLETVTVRCVYASKLRAFFRRKFLAQKPPQDLAQFPADSDAYPVFPPPTPEEFLAHADFYRERLSRRRWRTPKDQPEDTPLFSLYRLYERMVLNDNIGLRNEIEYLFYARWPVASIPDPHDSSSSRYAVLSTIPALLVESFNERIRLGLPRKADPIVTREELEQYQKEERIWEIVPEWTKQVAALGETLVIPHEDNEVLPSFEDERASPQLAAKNILHWQPHIHFI